MSATKSASTSTIGPSHHFLRTRMKAQSSPTSERIPERATRPTPPQAYLRLLVPVKHWKNRVFLGSSRVAAQTAHGWRASHAVAFELVDRVDEADVRLRCGPGAQVGAHHSTTSLHSRPRTMGADDRRMRRAASGYRANDGRGFRLSVRDASAGMGWRGLITTALAPIRGCR